MKIHAYVCNTGTSNLGYKYMQTAPKKFPRASSGDYVSYYVTTTHVTRSVLLLTVC